MNQSRSFLTAVFVCTLLLAASLSTVAQPEAKPLEPSFDVSLQLLIGSNDAAGRVELPGNLANVSRQLRGIFPFSNYRLASTLLGRVSNTGNYEYKSLTNIFGEESNLASQTFLEWSLREFRTVPTAKGAPGFQAQGFRFGARVPVTTGSVKDDTGKLNPTIAYEAIGLNLVKLGLPENEPTLIGTLNLPGANGTIFLIMTVRSADM